MQKIEEILLRILVGGVTIQDLPEVVPDVSKNSRNVILFHYFAYVLKFGLHLFWLIIAFCSLNPEPATCDYGPYCAIIDCKKTGAADLCPDQCSK